MASVLAGQRVLVPAHFDAEVLSAIRRLTRRKVISPAQAGDALLRLALLPAERAALAPLLSEAFALRDRFSAFDALYAVLGRQRAAALCTTDTRLARAARGYVDVALVDGFHATQK